MLAALRPGVAEEIWIRAFPILLLYLVFRRYALACTAMVAAALLGTYWFAFLHMPFNPIGIILLGTIQLLPMTFVWLRRGLEAAIGFHVCVDVIRFLVAFLAFQHVWSSKPNMPGRSETLRGDRRIQQLAVRTDSSGVATIGRHRRQREGPTAGDGLVPQEDWWSHAPQPQCPTGTVCPGSSSGATYGRGGYHRDDGNSGQTLNRR